MSNREFNLYLNDVSPILQAFALNLTNDVENSKDLFQETAWRALYNKDKFRTGTNFKAWIMTMMKNIFINDYRMRKRRKTQLEPTGSTALDGGSGISSNTAISDISQKELLKMIDKLEEVFRVPFWMYFTGFSYQEIADELEKPLGTIKSRIFHARKKLQKMIRETY